MSLELRPVQVRLPDEAYLALKLCADAEDKDLGEKARELLTKCLLGESHAVIEAQLVPLIEKRIHDAMVLAAAFQRAGITGSNRE